MLYECIDEHGILTVCVAEMTVKNSQSRECGDLMPFITTE